MGRRNTDNIGECWRISSVGAGSFQISSVPGVDEVLLQAGRPLRDSRVYSGV